MWLKKPSATLGDFSKVCEEIGLELGLSLSFEGRYKWIVFLNSKVDSRTPVLNRYYGLLEDDTLKVRGIELQRHDTPGIVNRFQKEALRVFSRAQDSFEFRALIPEVLSLLEKYVQMAKRGEASLEELVITKNISKTPDEYSNLVPQAIAAKRLMEKGGRFHAGQSVNFVLTRNSGAAPQELLDENTVCDWEEYRELLVGSAENLLLPLGYNKDRLRKTLSNP